MYCLLPHLVLRIAWHISMPQVHNVFRGRNISCIPIEASSLSELLLNFNDVYIFQAVSEQSISALRNNTRERERDRERKTHTHTHTERERERENENYLLFLH